MRETKKNLSPLVAASALTALVAITASPLAGQAPRAVSPGSLGGPALLAGSCPTFSWSGSDDATGYELVLYRVTESGTLETTFQIEVRAAAGSWTPAAAQCPAAASEYAWAVRAIGDEGPGAWSELLLFATPGTPSHDEVRQALETLRRYRGEREAALGQGLAPSRSGADEHSPGTVASQVPVRRSSSDTEARRYPHADGEALISSTLGNAPSPQIVTAPASFSLSLDSDLDLGGFVFQDGVPFIHNDGGANSFNTAVGLNALVSTTPGVPYPNAGLANSAFGYGALQNNTTGFLNTASGTYALNFNTTGYANTASGHLALVRNTTGILNTASGFAALAENTTGVDNTASGSYALLRNTSGNRNTANGTRALQENTTGVRNTASGFGALQANTTGFNSVAVGYQALSSNDSGARNTALGHQAMPANSSGGLNTAIGYRAGYDWTTGSSNIAIGHGTNGVAGESGVIRIGGNDLQTKTFIEGISGTNVAGVQVLIAGDQLGVAASSGRFKQDIHDLEGVSDRLQALHPVSFRYKDEFASRESNPLEYGLIAEEVAKVFPELVVYDEAGEPYTVRYHLLTPLLLAELQRQEEELARLRKLEPAVADLNRRLARVGRTVEEAASEPSRRLGCRK